MKTSISNVNGMETFVEIKDVPNPAGYKYLKITSIFDKATDPTDERVRYEMLMTPECMTTLKKIFEELQ